MTTPASTLRRPYGIALGICLACALLAFLLLRVLDDPWSGKLGRTIYGPGGAPETELAAYIGLARFYFDTTNPLHQKVTVVDWMKIGLRLSSVGILGAALLAALTAHWWVRWLRSATPSVAPERARIPRSSWILLLAALLLGLVLRLPAAWQYVTYDEQDNMRRNYHGYYEFTEPGQPPEWRQAGYAEAVWENSRVNNPFFFSTLSQLSQAAWRTLAGQPRERFSLPAMRLPSLVFGTAAIAAIWWMLHALGLPRLAPGAALLMSVHALALHHSVEARGYGMVLFFACLLPGMAWRVMQCGRKRDWAGYGLTLFCLLFSYPGTLYFVATLNLFVAASLAWRWLARNEHIARAGLARWTLTNAIAALMLLWLIAPAIPQALGEFQEKFPMGNLDAAWVLGAIVTYGSGLMPIYTMTDAVPGWNGPSSLQWFFTHFPRVWPIALPAFVIFPLLLAFGLRSLWAAGKLRAGLLLAAALAGGLMVAHHRLVTGYSLFHWYIIYILPAVLAIESAGLDALAGAAARRFGRSGRPAALSRIVLPALLAVWLLAIGFNWPGSSMWNDGIVYFSRQPPRDGWGDAGDLIERSEIPRGKSLWVTYRDGYLCRFVHYPNRSDAWQPQLLRHKSAWGVPPASLSPSAPDHGERSEQ